MNHRHQAWKERQVDEITFQKMVTEDIKRMVRRINEANDRREVCYVCSGTGRSVAGDTCVYCGGWGVTNVEERT